MRGSKPAGFGKKVVSKRRAHSVGSAVAGGVGYFTGFKRNGRRSLHEASTPDVLSGGPTWSGLYGPVSWLIFFQFEPHGLVRSIQRESSRVAPMEIRPPGFLIRGWSQEMWFRPLLGLGCVDSTDGAEQTDGRNLPPERPRWESNPRPPTCRPSALPTELVERFCKRRRQNAGWLLEVFCMK